MVYSYLTAESHAQSQGQGETTQQPLGSSATAEARIASTLHLPQQPLDSGLTEVLARAS